MNLDSFGFELDRDDWLERLREADRDAPLGAIGRYRVLQKVRRGGQGVVFQGTDPATGATVAIKRLIAGRFASDDVQRRFDREIDILRRVRHPGIVQHHEALVQDGVPVLVTEWIDGKPLDEWAAGAPPLPELLDVFLRLCDAVDHAHRHGVLHRDLKPSNILVDAHGQPHVLDFGLAKCNEPAGNEPAGNEPDGDETAPDSSSLTLSEAAFGTPAYSAPEQLLKGVRNADARSDVYSLGVILFEMATGTNPFRGIPSMTALLRAVEQDDLPRPSRLVPALPRDLDTVIAVATEKRPADRYPTVAALAADVRRIKAGDPVEAMRGRWYLLRRALRRHAVLATCSAGVVLLLTAYAVTTTWQARQLARQVARVRQMMDFVADDVLSPARHHAYRRNPTLHESLDAAVAALDRRFGDQPSLAAELRAVLARSYGTLGDHARAESLLREVLADPAAELDSRVRASVELVLSQARHVADDAEAARRHVANALRWATEECADPADPLRLSILIQQATLEDPARSTLEQEAVLREVQAVAQLSPTMATVELEASSLLAMRAVLRCDVERSETLLLSALERADQAGLGYSATSADCAAALSSAHRIFGDREKSEHWQRRALTMQLAAFGPDHPRSAAMQVELASVLALQGKGDEADRLLESALPSLRRAGESLPLANALFELGRRALAEERLEDAEAAAREARSLQIAAGDDGALAAVRSGETLAIIARRRGDLAEASKLLNQLLADLESNPILRDNVRCRIGAALADVELERGEREAAASAARDVLRRVSGVLAETVALEWETLRTTVRVLEETGHDEERTRLGFMRSNWPAVHLDFKTGVIVWEFALSWYLVDRERFDRAQGALRDWIDHEKDANEQLRAALVKLDENWKFESGPRP